MDKSMSHVLVVDDNQDCADSLALLIQMEGFSVATAATLSEARAQIQACPPRLIFLDLTLPDGHGIELLEQTRDAPNLDIVMLTGSGELCDSQRARQLGALDFLIKPASLKRLQSMLMLLNR